MGTPEAGQAGDDATLRAEHDALAEKLRIRRSIDELRTVAYVGFAAALSFGLAAKFAWDRWGWSKLPRPPVRGRYPVLFLLALVLFGVLLTVAIRAWRRAEVHRRSEESLYARLRVLRERLRLDP